MRLSGLVILLVAAVVVIFPAGVALADPPLANPVRALPDTVEQGGTFNVTVNFTAPADDFKVISLIDYAPDGWNVTVNEAECEPTPTRTNPIANKADITWETGSYANGTNFTVFYEVTVPCSASLGENYTFDAASCGALAYYVGNSSHIFVDVTGDSNVTVVPPSICSTPSIEFYATPGQNPANETLGIWSSTPVMLNWSLSDDADYEGHDWLSENPTNGTCTNVSVPVALSVNTSVNASSSMPIGDYSANITINATVETNETANHSPLIVPVILHVTETGTLKGQVNFTGRGDHGPNWIEPFDVWLFEQGNLTNVTWTGNANTDENGVFTIYGIAPGPYDIGIKNFTCLSELVTNVTINIGAPTEVDFGVLLEGDSNNDDKVTLTDLNNVLTFYATTEASCDFDRSGKVGLVDLNMMLGSYGLQGDLV